MKKLKDCKKTTLFVSCTAILAVIGGTIAYHTSNGSFLNLFRTGYWHSEVTEDFLAPDDWQPCREVPKTVVGKNEGNYRATVRLKYEEYWKLADSESTDHETELSLTDQEGDRIARVNLQNEEDWVDGGDGWYYYKFILEPGDETNSLLKSVTLDCKVNFAGENECSEEGNKITCTKPENQYDGAKYHVFVTVELLQQEGCGSSWGEEQCTSINKWYPTLYELVAEQTKGQSAFQEVYFSDLGGDTGVYTDSMSYDANSEYNVHFFRGAAINNYVKFANKCWRIVRTTDTGGVKIIYAGTPADDGGCKEFSSISDLVADEPLFNDHTPFNDTSSFYASDSLQTMDLRHNYWMFGDPYYQYNYTSDLVRWPDVCGDGVAYEGTHNEIDGRDECEAVNASYSSQKGTVYGNDVTWDANTGLYTLVDTYTLTTPQPRNSWSDSYSSQRDTEQRLIGKQYHYTCFSKGTTCEHVHYILSTHVFDFYDGGTQEAGHMTFVNGQKVEDVLPTIQRNDNSSHVKSIVDEWYENNLLDYSDRLEDSPFCADRTLVYSTLLGKDFDASELNGIWVTGAGGPVNPFRKDINLYRSAANLIGSVLRTGSLSSSSSSRSNSFRMSDRCSNPNDIFTVKKASGGNGALTYPIGLLEGDEVVSAGTYTKAYAASGRDTWANSYLAEGGSNSYDAMTLTMTPYGFYSWPWRVGRGGGKTVLCFDSADSGLYACASGYVRPVVSFKEKIRPISGDGTLHRPYEIK